MRPWRTSSGGGMGVWDPLFGLVHPQIRAFLVVVCHSVEAGRLGAPGIGPGPPGGTQREEEVRQAGEKEQRGGRWEVCEEQRARSCGDFSSLCVRIENEIDGVWMWKGASHRSCRWFHLLHSICFLFPARGVEVILDSDPATRLWNKHLVGKPLTATPHPTSGKAPTASSGTRLPHPSAPCPLGRKTRIWSPPHPPSHCLPNHEGVQKVHTPCGVPSPLRSLCQPHQVLPNLPPHPPSI